MRWAGLGISDRFVTAFSERVLKSELLLLPGYKSFILTGRPDCILFENGFPLIIFKYKFSRIKGESKLSFTNKNSYRITLKNMGFDVSKPKFYVIIVVDCRAEDDDQFKVRVVDSTLKNGLQEAVLTTKNAVMHLTFALGKQNLYELQISQHLDNFMRNEENITSDFEKS